MPKIKIVTSAYTRKMEEQINDLLSQGYSMHGELSTFDCWEPERDLNGRTTDAGMRGRRVQVTYFKQIMLKND